MVLIKIKLYYRAWLIRLGQCLLYDQDYFNIKKQASKALMNILIMVLGFML